MPSERVLKNNKLSRNFQEENAEKCVNYVEYALDYVIVQIMSVCSLCKYNDIMSFICRYVYVVMLCDLGLEQISQNIITVISNVYL